MKSLAAARRSRRSRIRRNDPTGSSRHIREYENQLVPLFGNYQRTIIQHIEREHHMGIPDGGRDLDTKVPIPPIDLRALVGALDIAVKGEVLTPGKQVTDKAVQRAYQQGTVFAGVTLRRAGLPQAQPVPVGEEVSTLGPADWRTIDWLKVRNLEVLKGITAETNKQIVLSLTEGINAGEGMLPLAKRITDAVDTIGITRARMMARTETMYAVNQGSLIRYTQAGVEKVEWLSATEDDRVCDECEALNGQIFDIDSVPEIPVHPNCVLGDTRCETPGGVIVGLRTLYDGPVLEIVTAKGRKLTITPNHLLLLEGGFIEADRLHKGDKVICRPFLQGVIPDHPDDNRDPPMIKEIITSLSISLGMPTTSVPVTAEDLHGDGRLCDGDIDIVGPHRHLLHSPKAAIFKHLRKAYLNGGGELPTLLAGYSPLAQFLFSAAMTADGGMSSIREASPLLRGGPRHTEIHGLAAPPGHDSMGPQPKADHRPGDPKQMRELLDRFAGVVELDEVININIRAFRGHVYDLQTVPTLYFGSGILMSNCRCCTAPVVE